jgi:hypothetical protein
MHGRQRSADRRIVICVFRIYELKLIIITLYGVQFITHKATYSTLIVSELQH